MTDTVTAIGATCFGVVVGFITYRTLVREPKPAISDLGAVVSAIGGGVVTGLFPGTSDRFGWYSIGLLAGMTVFFVLFWIMNGKPQLAKVMSGGTISLAGGQPQPPGQSPIGGSGPRE
jgi:hypothetical protein